LANAIRRKAAQEEIAESVLAAAWWCPKPTASQKIELTDLNSNTAAVDDWASFQ
jgi:hypothetical protein